MNKDTLFTILEKKVRAMFLNILNLEIQTVNFIKYILLYRYSKSGNSVIRMHEIYICYYILYFDIFYGEDFQS